MSNRGRPRIYDTVAEVEEIIEEYFKICEGELLKDIEGQLILNKYGKPIIIGDKPPTVTGLALALGLKSRQALLNYQEREEFNDAITRAKLVIEEYNERRLYDKDGVNGAKFNLINNFKHYSDKQEIAQNIKTEANITIESDLSNLSTDELKKLGELIEKTKVT